MKKRKAAREEEREERAQELKLKEKEERISAWLPKTVAGKLVKEGKINSYDELLSQNLPVLEQEIIDALIPNLMEKTIEVRKTTRVTRSGRNFSFRVAVLVGDGQALVGLGVAKDREKWPAVRKALKNAKLNLVKVRKGCGSWECVCGLGHSIPFVVEGKAGSSRIKLMPAPRGIGLVVGETVKDVFRFVGIEDVWSTSKGATDTRINFVRAAINALTQTTKMKLSKEITRKILK